MNIANQAQKRRRHVFVLAAWLAVLVLVPAGFILSGRFTQALRRVGVGLHPSLDGGRLLARGETMASPAAAGPGAADSDLRNLKSFSISEVRFRRFSGMGIAPRFNLCFEFADRLANPHDSPAHFSAIALVIFIAEGNESAAAGSIAPASLPAVSLPGDDWRYRVIIDGFHVRPRIYDRGGRLAALGMETILQPDDAEAWKAGKPGPIRLIAPLPARLLDPLRHKPLRFHLAAGAVDSGQASMLKLDANGQLRLFAVLTSPQKPVMKRDAGGRLLLPFLVLPPR